jgi:pimeloyl-ACP methyl ester carboxylesterase
MISVRTKHLAVKVLEGGPKAGIPVLLLHGWLDDATTWNQVSPHLHEAGFKTIAPMHRGFGGTRFLSSRTKRTGNVGVLCLDVIELMDALRIKHFL